MGNIYVALIILDENLKPPPTYKLVGVRLIFDVKIDFTRKSRWIAAGHMTPDPKFNTFAGVVSRECVRIYFTYTTLNGIYVVTADIQNEFL